MKTAVIKINFRSNTDFNVQNKIVKLRDQYKCIFIKSERMETLSMM